MSMTSGRHASQESSTVVVRPRAAAHALGSVVLPLYLARPLEKIEGISTEAVLSSVSAINSADDETRKQAERFFRAFFAGLLVRCQKDGQPSIPQEVTAELELLIRSRISDASKSTAQMLSILFMRGFAAIDDPNVWKNSDPLITSQGAAILALLWSRVTRHEYTNFRDQVSGHASGNTLSCSAGFGALDGLAAAGAQVIVDFEATDGNVSLGERKAILGTYRSNVVQLSGTGVPASVRVCVHAAEKFALGAGDSLVFDHPIPLRADPGSVVAVDLLADNQVGNGSPGTTNVSPLNPKGFAVVQSKDIQGQSLIGLSSVVWPFEAKPQFGNLKWARIALCSPKTITMRPYVPGPGDTQAENSLILLEQDQEDDVCFSARIVVSGAESNKISLGPPNLVVRRVPSSVLPTTPVIQAVKPAPWNIRLCWVTKTMPSGTEIYDDSNQFQVGLECTPLFTTLAASFNQGRTLYQILSGIPTGAWPQDENEWTRVGNWLSGAANPARLVDGPPTFLDDPKVFKFPKAGSLLIAPTKTGSPDEYLPWSSSEDIAHWRREGFVWRMRLRSVENTEFPEFTMFSDWTLPTEPVASLPLIPQFGSQTKTYKKFPRPAVEINVNYATQFRSGSDTTLSYRLVVRKALATANSRKGQSNDLETALFSERVIGANAPDWNGKPPYVWRFRFLDQEIAPPDTLDRGRIYQYELELQQLDLVDGSEIVVTKSKILSLDAAPNQSLDVEANEPSYE